VTSWPLTGPEIAAIVEIMGENMRWFGRKSAPDVRPFVPAWLSAEGQSSFARSTHGLTVLEKSTGSTLRYRGGAWEQILGVPQPPIPDVTGGTTADSESRAVIAAILSALRAHGLITA
jgi:hypothetical protein